MTAHNGVEGLPYCDWDEAALQLQANLEGLNRVGGVHGERCGGAQAGDVQFCVAVGSECSYMRKVLSRQFRRRRYLTVVRGPPTPTKRVVLQWDEYESIDWEAVLRGELMANAYCIRKGLSRKAQLSIYLNKYIKKHADSILKKAVPRTIVVDTWEAFSDSLSSFGPISFRDRLDSCLWEVKDVLHREGGCWIMKPSATNKGAEVHVIKDYDTFRNIVYEWTDIREWVVQAYVDKPLLVRNRKFHLRAYVLAVGCLKVYLFQEVLVLTAMEHYDANDVDNEWSHITNTAHQQQHPQFVEKDCVFLLSDLPQLLEAQGVVGAKCKVDATVEAMGRIIADMFDAYKGEFSVFQPLANCFELFGVDFLVDDSWNVWLLEVNCGPDFKNTGERLRHVIDNLVDDTITVGVDQLLGIRHDPPLGRFIKVYDEAWGFAAKAPPCIAFQ